MRATHELTIVPADKSVTVAAPPRAVDVLGAVLERDVHVSVNGLEGAFGALSASWWLEWRGTMGGRSRYERRGIGYGLPRRREQMGGDMEWI